jgi:hypothetical protein
MAPQNLEDLLTQAARERRLARAIPDDPMGQRLAQVADELDAEIDREAKIIKSLSTARATPASGTPFS